MEDNKFKLEEAFEELEGIIKNLETPEVSLEDSFLMYQEGMKLLKACNDSIDKVEKELMVLNERGENNEL